MTAGTPQPVRMVELGRVVFSHQALPAIRPVNHLVEDSGDIVIRTHTGATLLGRAALSEVVAYEADALAPATRTGWSVVVTGTASQVSDPARYQTALTPWVDTEMEHVVRIRADIVTGYRLVASTPAPDPLGRTRSRTMVRSAAARAVMATSAGVVVVVVLRAMAAAQ